MEETIVSWLAPFVVHLIVSVVSGTGGLLLGFLLHRPHFRKLSAEIAQLKARTEEKKTGEKNGGSDAIDDRVDYVTATQIIANYLGHAFEDVKPRIQIVIVHDLLHHFERSPQARIGDNIYSREKLRVWLEFHMGKLLIKHRGEL